MKNIPLILACFLSAVLVSSAAQVAPQDNMGSIEVQVVHPGSSEGIPGIQLTLVGPRPPLTVAALSSLYTPDPALTPAMREQIDAYIASAAPMLVPEDVAADVARIQAHLLGKPEPEASFLASLTQSVSDAAGGTTDGSGIFRFKNLPTGRYQILAQRDGYFAAPIAGSAMSRQSLIAVTATVTNGKTTPEVTIAMIQGGRISGTVRDPTGKPAFDLQVSAYQIDYQDRRAVIRSSRSANSDDHGAYRLYGLFPGDYFIAVAPKSSGQQGAFARTFFPGTIDATNAQTVTLKEASEVTSVNISIQAEATTISGRVVHSFVGTDGQPRRVSTFYLLPANPSELNDNLRLIFSNTAVDRSDGKFELRGVLPGVYDLMSMSTDNDGRTAWGRTRIRVGSGGLQGISLPIQPGVSVTAHLTVDGAAPPFKLGAEPGVDLRSSAAASFSANFNGGRITIPPPPKSAPGAPANVPTPEIRLILRSVEYNNSEADVTANQKIAFKPNGTYVFPNVSEGKYYMQATPLPPNAYIADVQIGGVSVFDHGFDVGGNKSPIEVTIRSNGGTILGSVTDDAKKPRALSTVALVPQPSRRSNLNLYASSESDALGNFSFTGIAPGDYKVFAWDSVPGNAWTNAEFLAKYEERGQSITVTPAASARMELKLIPK